MISYYKDKHDFNMAEIVSLWKSVGWTSGSLDHPERLMEALKHGEVYCAYDGDRLVGLVEAFDDTYTVFINYLLIHPDYQKQGIGTILMNMIEERYHGYRQAITTDEAKEFYERLGYKCTSYGMHK